MAMWRPLNKVGMGNERIFFQAQGPACAKPRRCEMVLWLQELQVAHYCCLSNASEMRRENIDLKKNARSKNQILQHFVCLVKEAEIYPFHDGKHWSFKGKNMVRLERPLYGVKWRRNWGRICVSQARQKDKLIDWLFFYPSWCPLFPPTASTPHPPPVLRRPPCIKFLCGKEVNHLSLWLQVIIKTNWYKCERRYKTNNCLIRKSSKIIAAFSQMWPYITSVKRVGSSMAKCLQNSGLNKIESSPHSDFCRALIMLIYMMTLQKGAIL